MANKLTKKLADYSDAELNDEWLELENLDAEWSHSDGERFLAIEVEMNRRADAMARC